MLKIHSPLGVLFIHFHSADTITISNLEDRNQRNYLPIVVNGINIRIDATYHLKDGVWANNVGNMYDVTRLKDDLSYENNLPAKTKSVVYKHLDTIINSLKDNLLFLKQIKIAKLNQAVYRKECLAEEILKCYKRISELEAEKEKIDQDKKEAEDSLCKINIKMQEFNI